MAQYLAEGALHAVRAATCRHSPSRVHVRRSGWSDRHSTIIERGTCRDCSAGIARAVPDVDIPATCGEPWVTAGVLDDAPTVTCPNRWDAAAASRIRPRSHTRR